MRSFVNIAAIIHCLTEPVVSMDPQSIIKQAKAMAAANAAMGSGRKPAVMLVSTIGGSSGLTRDEFEGAHPGVFSTARRNQGSDHQGYR